MTHPSFLHSPGFRIVCATGLLFLVAAWPARADLLLDFSDENETYDPSQVYLTFQTALAGQFSATYVDTNGVTQQLALGSNGLSTAVSLAEIGGQIDLQSMNSGVIYLSYGSPIPATSPAPNPSYSYDPSYNTRWQSLAEITYLGKPSDSGDLTYIQSFAVPAQIQVMSGGTVQQEAGITVPTAVLNRQLAALSSTPDQVVVTAASGPSAGQVVRVLAPNQFGPSGNPNIPVGQPGGITFSIGGYASFQPYVNSLYANNVTTTLKGILNGSVYTFTVRADAQGNLVLVGGSAAAPGKVYTITIPHDSAGNSVLSWDIYACAGTNQPAGYGNITVTSSDGSTIDAALLAQGLHDLFSGLNFGFVGSATIDPVTGVAFGAESSDLWFKDATASVLFAGLQPDNPYYNQYAKVIFDDSDGTAYGFPYSDAVNPVALNTVQTPDGSAVTSWDITILPDAAPEPSTWGCLVLALGLAAGYRGFARRGLV
jgi:hypothetical protein